MQLSRRSFLASLAGALVAPRLALPAPVPGMQNEVAPEVIAFHEYVDDSVFYVRLRVVLVGRAARQALAADPRMWSAVMVKRQLTIDGKV